MGVNDLQPKMSTKLSNFLSKNTHFRKTHSVIKHHENKCKEEEAEDDHREQRKKNKGWSFFLKNKLSSKIYTVFSKIGSGSRSPSSNNNNGDQHNHGDDNDGLKEKQRKSVGEILINGTRGPSGGDEGKKMAVNRSRSLKKGLVVVKKKKMKMGKEIVMERKQSIRRNGHRHHRVEEEEDNELCKKRILIGIRCKPINSSGAPLYDENGVIPLD